MNLKDDRGPVVANKKIYCSVFVAPQQLVWTFFFFVCKSGNVSLDMITSYTNSSNLRLSDSLQNAFIVICRVPENAILTFTNSHTSWNLRRKPRDFWVTIFMMSNELIHEKESHGNTSILSCRTGYDHCSQITLPQRIELWNWPC